MTAEHLRVLLDSPSCTSLLGEAASQLAQGNIPEEVVSAIRLGRMTALQKPDGGVRGIVVGDVFRRVVARTIAQQYAKLGEAATHPFQHALSTRAGTECVTHIVQAMTSEDREATILSIDGIGAYDIVSRNAMFRGVADMVKLVPFMRLFYGSPSTFLWEDDEGTVHHVRQGEGGEQGDPLMPLLFSLGLHRALVSVKSQLEDGEKFFAFLDDVYVICRPSRVLWLKPFLLKRHIVDTCVEARRSFLILFPVSTVMPPRRSPRLAEPAQRAENVSIALDDDDTESLQSTAVCFVCGDESLRSSLVHIPCCDYLTHPTCVDDDIDALCPYCSMDLRSTLEHIGNSSCPECGDAVDPSSAGHGALCMFSCCLELLSPREIQCSALVAEEDVVIMLMWVGSSECATSTVLNGQCPRKSLAFCAWIRWVRTVLQFHVAIKRSMLVASLSVSMLVGRCPFCVQQLREFAESHGFQAAALFHGHSVDVSGQPTNRGTNSLVLPSGFPSPPENLSLLCCSRVGPPPQFEPSADRRMEWSPVWQQSTLAWDLQWICISCSRTVPAGDIPSCPQVPYGVCGDPSHMVVDSQSWNWCSRCQTRVESSLQEVRRTWFSHGPLASMGPLYGWSEHPITVPGQGPQSWLFCPIISLALAVVERGHAVWSHQHRNNIG